MPSVDQLRKHVIDDVLELAATTGMLVPLIDADLNTTDEAHAALRFLRQHLVRHVALIVTRLHDDISRQEGPIGSLASIPVLVECARSASRLSGERADAYLNGLSELRDEYAARGGDFQELLAFRHSELAHSLHRRSPPSVELHFNPLWELAHDTYELVADLERWLDQTGMDPMVLENRFDYWRDTGAAFWSTRLSP
jgi:hypothetical protein